MKIGKNVVISPKVSIYGDNIEIGDNVRIDDFCLLSCGKGFIKIGSYSHIACYTALYGGAGIIIGDFASISSRISFYSESDDYSGETMSNPNIPLKYKKITSGLITLGRHVSMGTTATVMPGVTIGDGVSTGAYSFINHDCLPWNIYAGVPAKIIKPRSKKLLELEQQFLKEKCV